MRIGIVGGSFNPVHMGHMRLALEALEKPLPGENMPLDRLDLIPSAQPPHKSTQGLLPFALRLALLKAAVQNTPLRVNALEGERAGPSYTWDTLCQYRAAYPLARLFFYVGGEDFDAMAGWHRGLELPSLADIVMVARGRAGRAHFAAALARQWPQAQRARDVARLPCEGRMYFIALPRLDVSASDVRRRWCAGRSVRFLMPDAALHVLEKHRAYVTASWCDCKNI